MGRKKKSLVEKSPIKLRKRKLSDGNLSLFLDRSVNGGHEYEFLQLYLLPEISTKTKRENAQTLRKAEDILRERTKALLDAQVETQQERDSDMLLSEWLQTCYNNHEKRGARSLGSISNVKRALLMFRPDVRLSEIDRQFCLDLIDWLWNTYKHRRTGKPVSAKTADTYCQTFRTALNEAVRERLIGRNPWNQLETFEKIRKPESKREYLTIDEVKRMAATPCPNRLVKQAYLFSCFTGLRISDVKKLNWSDVSVDNGQACISVVMQKTGAPVYIPLSGQAMKWMPAREDAAPDNRIFGTLVNSGNVNENLRRWAKAAGVNKHVSYHVARHTFATMLLTLGADLYTTSKLLGHSDVKTTQIYAKIVDSKKVEAVNLVDNVFD